MNEIAHNLVCLPTTEVYVFDPNNQFTIGTAGLSIRQELPVTVNHWLQDLLLSSHNIAEFTSPLVNDSDPRVRPIDAEEIAQVDQYFENEGQLAMIRTMLSVR